MEKQVSKEHYKLTSYLTKERWSSYYYQIKETLDKKPKSVLIIGIGDKIVYNILKNEIKEVRSFDIDEELEPDYLGNILNLSNIVDKNFDVVLVCQVLEHLPFENFEDIVKEISKVTNNCCIISLPQEGYYFELTFKVPFFSKKEFRILLPRFFKEWNFEIDGNMEHYWELNLKNYPLSKIRKILRKYFELNLEYTVKENIYHRFFILEKKK